MQDRVRTRMERGLGRQKKLKGKIARKLRAGGKLSKIGGATR